MSDIEFWKLRSGYRECWPSWKRHDIVSVGWDIGDVRKIQERTGDTTKTKQHIKQRLDDKFGDHDSWKKQERDSAAGIIRSVVGIRGNEARNFNVGDTVVVLGQQIRGESIIHGVAEVGEYVYGKYDVEEDEHPYQREVEYRVKGPVRIKDLPDEFHDLSFRGTLVEYKGATDEKIDRLVNAIEEIIEDRGRIESRDTYFDYNILSEEELQKYIEDHHSRVDERIVDIEREHQIDGDNRIDHICSLKSGDKLGIEVKLGTATPAAVNQLVRYLTRLSERLDSDKSVQGLLIAEDFREDTITKARSEELELAEYRISADFERTL